MINLIDRKSLERYASSRGIENAGHAEKDYLQDLILLSISRNTSRELIFKGGTALSKFYSLDRFSVDLDFTVEGELDLERITGKAHRLMENFGAENQVEELEEGRGRHFRYKIKGPLYQGDDISICSIHLDLNTESDAISPESRKRFSPYPDIPSFDLQVMSEREILAEKVRAIMTRDQPRDVYDLWFLLSKGVKPDRQIIDRKLEYYDTQWRFESFEQSLEGKEKTWNKHLSQLLGQTPEFSEVRTRIVENLKDL